MNGLVLQELNDDGDMVDTKVRILKKDGRLDFSEAKMHEDDRWWNPEINRLVTAKDDPDLVLDTLRHWTASSYSIWRPL